MLKEWFYFLTILKLKLNYALEPVVTNSLPHMVDHIFMAFLVPLQNLWTPWTIFVPLMFPRPSLKTLIICYTRILNHFSLIHADINLKPVYIGMCEKGQIFLEFSLMWIRVTCLLALHMP